MGDLGKTIKALREERRLSQRELARLLGISHTRLRAYEAGVTKSTDKPAVPAPELLQKIAERLGYPYETLLALGGYPARERKATYLTESEAEAEEVVDIFRRLPEPQRRLFLKIARAFKSEA